MRSFYLLLFVIMNSLIGGCQPEKKIIISEKNNCFASKLSSIKPGSTYKKVMSEFMTEFETMKNQKEYFGITGYVENKIDDAVFFNKNADQCLIVVLQKSSDTIGFGGARVVNGYLSSTNNWSFSPSIDFSFDKDYFKLFAENNFDNISQLARYSVLTEGKVKRSGCEIDEYYWFTYLKK
jgi:hypothetical protein